MNCFQKILNKKVVDYPSTSNVLHHQGNEYEHLSTRGFKKSDKVTDNKRYGDATACVVITQNRTASMDTAKDPNSLSPEPDGVVKVIKNVAGLACFNFFKLKRSGHNFFLQKMKACKSTVYKVSLGKCRIMLCDHVSVNAVFDEEKVEKDFGFGFMKFNPVILKDFLPTMFANGCDHTAKKSTMLRLKEHVCQNFSFEELTLYVEDQFKTMTVMVADLKKGSPRAYNFEDVVEKAVGCVVTKILLGKPIDDLTLLENWLDNSLEFKYLPDFTDDDETDLANRLFAKFKDTPTINTLREMSISSPGFSIEDAIKDLVWTTIFNAFGGVKNLVLSAISLYLKLTPNDRALLLSDAKVFFQTSDNRQELLSTLNTLDAFYIEALRLFPPATSVFALAKRDFVLDSTSGKYQVQKGDTMCGYIYAAQRDPTLFESPNSCLLNRDVDRVKKHLYTFGGPYNTHATCANHKCIGQDLAEMIVKLFVLHLTRCKMVTDKYPAYTGRNLGRFVGTDYPLSVSTFQYDEEGNEN